MKRKNNSVSVIEASGRAGLGFSLVIANNGFNVIGIDKNADMNNSINNNKMKYIESDGQEYLNKAIRSGKIRMTSDLKLVSLTNTTVVIVGTSVDENLNPVISPLVNLMRELCKFIKSGHLLIVRSTVTPGFSDRIVKLIERESELRIGKNVFYVYAPERAVCGKIIKETQELPQVIGAYEEQSYKLAETFFKKFVKSKIFRLKPIEAEIGKSAMNAVRYVNFAFANFLYLTCEEYGANVHSIIDAFNSEYPTRQGRASLDKNVPPKVRLN